MNAPIFAAIKAGLSLSLNDANWHEDKSMTYAVVVNCLIRRYATDAVTEKASGEIRDFQQGRLAL